MDHRLELRVDKNRPAALLALPDAMHYLGKIGKTLFYQSILPELDVVMLGSRKFVTVESCDRLIAKRVAGR